MNGIYSLSVIQVNSQRVEKPNLASLCAHMLLKYSNNVSCYMLLTVQRKMLSYYSTFNRRL